jgi:lysozyme
MMDSFINALMSDLERDEGRRGKPYKDTEGILTIGVGWNLEANVLPDRVIDLLLRHSIYTAYNDALELFPKFADLSDNRQRALVNMAFNLGRYRLSGFKKMIAAVNSEDWDKASVEMLDSKWARQVGDRADRLSVLMAKG